MSNYKINKNQYSQNYTAQVRDEKCSQNERKHQTGLLRASAAPRARRHILEIATDNFHPLVHFRPRVGNLWREVKVSVGARADYWRWPQAKLLNKSSATPFVRVEQYKNVCAPQAVQRARTKIRLLSTHIKSKGVFITITFLSTPSLYIQIC
jgi:hypothetical protein